MSFNDLSELFITHVNSRPATRQWQTYLKIHVVTFNEIIYQSARQHKMRVCANGRSVQKWYILVLERIKPITGY